ncbi:MAG: NADH-quinone oxidoreductase subunit D [Anaerolineae bacterium]|nr:NADH-quinone oxidoreductase subunit D [Anaerolineae bacterium]
MSDVPTQEEALAPADVLIEKYPGAVSKDTREGYEGVVVDAGKLVEVATALRDELGFKYLASATAVDYLEDEYFEMVYHACNVDTGGKPLVFKARTARAEAVLPSLVSVWPGADFQEREAWDLMGIRFTGHPNLRRILMWEGFEGHPLRKDWQEPYYEEDAKPFDSRWPEGHVCRAEQLNPYGMNVRYPPGFIYDGYESVADDDTYSGMGVTFDEPPGGIKTGRLVVNIGPHHPSTHGVFRMVATLDGETIEDLHPVMGYLHRNHEKIGERNTFLQNMPYTDRLDYICSMSNNLGYALAVEKLMGVEVPERAELIRVLMVELTRYVNHLWAIGFLLNDLGAFYTPAIYVMNARELILDFFEATAGSRMMCNYMRFGGVFADLPPTVGGRPQLPTDVFREYETMAYLKDLVYEQMPRFVDEFDALLTQNEIVISRARGVGILPPDMAIAYSASGPLLRASGVPYDLRHSDPYSIYDEFDWDIAVRYNGDVYDRLMLRFDEIRQSIRILQQVVPRLEATQGQPVFSGRRAYQVRVPAGESYGRIEAPKGELGFYVVSNGSPNPWRYHVRSTSFINVTGLGELCKGHKVADVVAILGSIDIILGEVDR